MSKTAKWIMNGNVFDLIVCSNCRYILKSVSECLELKTPNICPECKSKMTNGG